MNAVTVFNPGAMRPAFATNAPLSAIAKALAGSGMSGKRLSIKGGVFRLIVDGKEVTALEERHLDVVIVRAAAKVSSVFYAGAYVDGQATAPACFSADGDLPDASVRSPQGKSCATCPQNVKGSGQGDSRACRYNQQLAVVLANDMEGDVLQLSLAATSIFGKGEGENRPLQDYVRYYAAQNVDIAHVITRLRFDTASPVPKLFFRPARYLTEDEHEIAQAQGGTPEAERAVTMTVSQTDGVAPVAAAAPVSIPAAAAPKAAKPAPVAAAPQEEEDEPPPPPPKAKPKAKPVPVAAAPQEEDTSEPVVRKAAPAATSAAPAASSLAQALAEWDDE
jgi:hypothetical protein